MPIFCRADPLDKPCATQNRQITLNGFSVQLEFPRQIGRIYCDIYCDIPFDNIQYLYLSISKLNCNITISFQRQFPTLMSFQRLIDFAQHKINKGTRFATFGTCRNSIEILPRFPPRHRCRLLWHWQTSGKHPRSRRRLPPRIPQQRPPQQREKSIGKVKSFS